jgi:isopenicillin-N epimerase
VQYLQARNVAVLIDAAHAPGMVPVDIAALRPDFWTGNFHKWAFSGLTVAGLYVAERWRNTMRAPIVSHDEEAGYPVSFGLQGTLDYSVAATLPIALALLEKVGWQALARRNHNVAVQGADLLAEALETRVVEGASRGSMTLVELPPGAATTPEQAQKLQERIEDELRAQVSIVAWGGCGYLRLSVQGYVTLEDIAAFAERTRHWDGMTCA